MNRRKPVFYRTKRKARHPNWRHIGITVLILACTAVSIYVIAVQNGLGKQAADPQVFSTAPMESALPTTAPSPAVITPEPTGAIVSTPSTSASPTISPAPKIAPTPSPTPKPSQTAQSDQIDSILKSAASQYKSRQVVVVLASGTQAEVALYEQDSNGGWDAAVKANGSVGRSGVSSNRKEGDGSTPAGLYKFGFAFGNNKNPGTKLEYREVTSKSYWVDDSSSQFYNQWVEGTESKDWDSAEVLAQAPSAYAYAIVVEYNYGSSAVAGKGSAIFLHCGTKPTSGCIDIPQSALVSMLKVLDPAKNPVIAIQKKK